MRIMFQSRKRRIAPATSESHRRTGATLVEAAIVLSVFLIIIFGMIDLMLVVWKHNMVSDIARRGTREAAVRGTLAAPQKSAWGPETFSGTAADAHEIAQFIRSSLVGFDPEDVSIVVEWPDGGNAVQMRVRCTIQATHRYMIASTLFNGSTTLRATSTLLIAH